MKELFVNKSIMYLKNNNACKKEDINKFKYVLECLYSLVSKTFVVLLISIFLRTFKITFITILLFSILRGFTFGIHSSKNSYCWLTTIGIYGIFPYLIKITNISSEIIIISYIIGIISVILFAPSDTPKRPLINKKKRIVNKFISLGILLIYMLISYYINDNVFYKIICFINLLTMICINPLTYKIFKVSYNNYKNY